MEVTPAKVRKILSAKISQLNDIVADLDTLVREIGFEFYRVCIFGSARIKKDSDEYKRVYELAYKLAQNGADIVTGGGPGLMEAANHGAQDGSKECKSIGISIYLPHEATPNSHLDLRYHHRRFSSRLDEFMRISHAVVVTPGGIGTLLELMFTWQLMQVGHIDPKPIILLGYNFWNGFIEWIKSQPLNNNLLDLKDLKFLTLLNNVDEVIDFLKPSILSFKTKHNSNTNNI